jgi:hypothetical protein
MYSKLEWKGYHFDIGYHHGLKKFYVEIYNLKKNKLEEERYDFESFTEAKGYISKYGYHNVGRFLCTENILNN